MAKMTHRDRVLKTFSFQPTDRVPYDLMEGCVWPELMAHFRDAYALDEPPAVQDFLDVDFRWAGMIYQPPADGPDSPYPEKPTETSQSREISKGPLADARTVAEVESYAWLDPSWWQPGDYSAARGQWPQHALVFSPGWWPLFWTTCETFGVEAALVNLVTAPALFECAVRCIHERFMDRLARGLAAARGHCDLCWLADDFASQQSMFLSPEHWRRFIKPYLAQQVELVRSHGMQVLYHSCGSVRPVLPDLIDIGVGGLLVFQTTAAGMDAPSIARDFGGRLAFYGGVDIQHLLSFGTPEAVAEEVEANMRAFAECGGYVVANSHHRIATIRGENIEAMCNAARYGPAPMTEENQG